MQGVVGSDGVWTGAWDSMVLIVTTCSQAKLDRIGRYTVRQGRVFIQEVKHYDSCSMYALSGRTEREY